SPFFVIANNPVEINCIQHKGKDELLIAGEYCLKRFLNNNNNICPIQSHSGCDYHKVKTIQKQLDELIAICPRQYKLEMQEITSIESIYTQDITDYCWFKPFGCDSYIKDDLKRHLIDDMRRHFELVINKFDSMQKIIKQLQDCAEQLKTKRDLNEEKLKEEIKKLNDENLLLKQQLVCFSKFGNEVEELKAKKSQASEIEEKKHDSNVKTDTQLMSYNILSKIKLDSFQSSAKLIHTFNGHRDCVIVQHLMVTNSFALDQMIKLFVYGINQNVICSSVDNKIRFWDFKNNIELK
ncbi:hypothetical protein RFI_38411, partial [Reticulomyxa filosa]